MDWVKKNWIVLVCGLVAVAGIGIGVWSLMGFQEVQAQAEHHRQHRRPAGRHGLQPRMPPTRR